MRIQDPMIMRTVLLKQHTRDSWTNCLWNKYSGLNEDEKYLIALTCLGYPNTTVSYLLNISETNLSTKRTRLAQKMSLGKSLVKYLNERLASYQAG